MENNEQQLIISAFLGDGHIRKGGYITYTSIHKEYLIFKQNLSEKTTEIKELSNNGYKKDSKIFKLSLKTTDYAKNFSFENLKDINELGLALWFYDDISLHKKKHFYNINSHSFSEEEHDLYLIPLLNKFKIFPKKIKTFKNGKNLWYLTVQKYKGGLEIDRILRKFEVKCFNYKLLPNQDIQNFNYLRNKFKNCKIQSTTLSKLITKNREEFLDKIKHIIKIDDFIALSKRYKKEENKDTIHL